MNDRPDVFSEMRLDDALRAARASTEVEPSPDLMSRVLADAAAVSAARAATAVSEKSPDGGGGFWARLASALSARGWSAAGPVAACALSAAFGFWLGAAAPADMTNSASDMIAALGADSIVADGAASLDLSAYDVAMIDEDDF